LALNVASAAATSALAGLLTRNVPTRSAAVSAAAPRFFIVVCMLLLPRKSSARRRLLRPTPSFQKLIANRAYPNCPLDSEALLAPRKISATNRKTAFLSHSTAFSQAALLPKNHSRSQFDTEWLPRHSGAKCSWWEDPPNCANECDFFRGTNRTDSVRFAPEKRVSFLPVPEPRLDYGPASRSVCAFGIAAGWVLSVQIPLGVLKPIFRWV